MTRSTYYCAELKKEGRRGDPRTGRTLEFIARLKCKQNMEQKHRNILQTSFVFLTKNIYNVEDVCDYLEMDEILTSGMVDEIKHKKPAPTAQVGHMLTILPRRGRRAYESFVAALIKTENKDSSDFLRAKEKSHDEKGDNSKKSEGPSQTTQDKGWPDLQNSVHFVLNREIRFSSKEDVTLISENYKTYHMTGKNKGKLVITSNVAEHYKLGPKRTSHYNVDFDKTSIQQLFRYMKFEYKSKSRLPGQTGEELKKSLKEIGEDTESSYDSLVVVILSGGNGFEPDQIYDKDGKMIPRDDVLQIIRDSPAFKGKPKIVIINTYNFEDATESYDTLDAAKAFLNIGSRPNNDDMFVVSSSPMTKMGPWMIGDNGFGSYFIQAFIYVFKNQAYEKSFLQLIEEVNKLLHTAMVPESIEGKSSDKCTKTHVAEAVVFEYSKEKELFLFPGQCDIPVITMKDPQSPMMGTSDEIKVDKELLSKGTFMSYDNCVYLAGACNVGKSTLASILIGEEISQDWKSTDGLTIYFGRNGIDLKNKEMVPLNQDSDRNVLSKVIRGKPDMTPEKPDTTHREEVLPHDSNKGNIIPETHTNTQRTDITAPTPSPVPGTGKDDVNITDPVRQQSPQNYIITTIQEDIKEQIRKGTYTMDIAPSDLVDFGGQRSFDMTHQLFMRRKGTFVLMFNGSINFLVPLKEYEQGETTESILKHWVNSILSYCADDEDILPIIMFCATHSDDYQEDRIDRKAELIHNLRELFENHKEKHHIIYDEIFFINGKNKNDLEIKQLKSKLVEVAFKQESWGERVPMAWVPLDLQMSKMRRVRNVNIISKEELTTLNQTNGDLALPVKEITNFLNVQHSLGKILYIDQHGLDNFIVVQPQSLVNILRSFITAEHFWPKDEELRGILCTLTNTGKIARQDLLKLWSQKKFDQHMPNDDYKEFIIQVLVHLDILVEPRHHRQEQESKVQSYLVPCIVKRRLPVTDIYVKSADKMLSLSYTLLKSSIPAALSFKLIGAAINLWPLKKTQEGICLYHQAAILCIDGSNDLHLLVEDDKVFVYLINEVTKCFISPNMASMVQECLTLTMTKVLEFYHKSFGKSLSTLDVSKAFEIKVGEWCTSGGGCYISVPELEEKTEWLCKNKKTHEKTYPRYWISNKKQVECDEKCPGLDEKYLELLLPEDKHLFKLAKLITVNECDNLFIKLGLSRIIWKDIKDTTYGSTLKKFVALCEWKDLKHRQMSKSPFKELSNALAEDHHTHFLCQLFMEDVTVYDIANSALQEIPEDDVLQDLSKEVKNCAVHLGVELGLSMAAIEGIRFKDPNNMFKQNFGVMEEWKSSSKVKPTIFMLMKAFQLADGKGLMFLREKYMGNDQRGQGYQSSIEHDAEPYISSDNNKRVHDFENKTGEEATQQVDMKTMKILTEVSNSIGMFVGKFQGSCWRAGTDLIVTAWHVVHDHIREYGFLNEITLKEVKIKFDYTGSGDCDESNIFEVEPRVLYHNETLDTAILRLKPNDKVVTFPPPFRRLDRFLKPANDEHLMIYLIGHPDGSPQRVNLGVGLWNPTEERMKSLATFCKDEGYEYDGYAELDKTERLVVKCEFEHGASGCPGVVILGDNQVYLVTMFLRGFPGFYYSRLFKEEKKKKFPKSKLFQQGVNIEAIYDDLKKNPMYADIFKDIFKQNPPVNMGPSENYTDGYQDCHDRVSTSTRPTSDEGTHHVTSPCEEETNENVSTCTHPTTVERQGSQMVVSEGSSPVRGTKRKLEEEDD